MVLVQELPPAASFCLKRLLLLPEVEDGFFIHCLCSVGTHNYKLSVFVVLLYSFIVVFQVQQTNQESCRKILGDREMKEKKNANLRSIRSLK